MAGFSNSLETELLTYSFGTTAPTRSATLYLALCTTAPTDASVGSSLVEPSLGAYERQSIAPGASRWSISGDTASNAVAITFGPFTSGTATVTHWALVSASSGGTVKYWGAFDASRAYATGDRAVVQIGELEITHD